MTTSDISSTLVTVFEHENLFERGTLVSSPEKSVETSTFHWLERQALEASGGSGKRWIDIGIKRGRKSIRLFDYVGILRAPDGTTIEILPKTGATSEVARQESKELLVAMIESLFGLPPLEVGTATLDLHRMSLADTFLRCFVAAVERIARRGFKRDYVSIEENAAVLKGRLLVGQHVRRNTGLLNRFFVRFDVFSEDRPENRLLRSALSAAFRWVKLPDTRIALQKLSLVFQDVPPSSHPDGDFQRVRLERGREDYYEALRWARLLLQGESPVSKVGTFSAPSLLFSMNGLFEAYVTRHLPKQLRPGYRLRAQVGNKSLVRHRNEGMFRLKPDLLLYQGNDVKALLDTKWKRLDARKSGSREKYGLSQDDFYQLLAYGSAYLSEGGPMALVFPLTETFFEPLPVFEYGPRGGLKLWALPYRLSPPRLSPPRLLLPHAPGWSAFFPRRGRPAWGRAFPTYHELNLRSVTSSRAVNGVV